MPRDPDPDGADGLFPDEVPPPGAGAEGRSEPAVRQGGVIIVDDAPLFRTKVRAILAAWRYPLLEAGDGRRALELTAQANPRLILLDIHMPGMDGLQVLERLDADEDLRRIPVVVLTADAESATVRAAMRGRADAYLLKTSDPQEIRERLEKYLGPPAGRRQAPEEGRE